MLGNSTDVIVGNRVTGFKFAYEQQPSVGARSKNSLKRIDEFRKALVAHEAAHEANDRIGFRHAPLCAQLLGPCTNPVSLLKPIGLNPIGRTVKQYDTFFR